MTEQDQPERELGNQAARDAAAAEPTAETPVEGADAAALPNDVADGDAADDSATEPSGDAAADQPADTGAG